MKSIILGQKKERQILEGSQSAFMTKQKIRSEDVHKRTAYAKHFKNQDGTYTMEMSSEPIHYFDNTTKQYEDIDNTLLEDEASLRLTGNDFSLEFAKEMSNHQVLKLNKGKTAISLKYHGKKERDHHSIFNRSRAKARNKERLVNRVTYEEVAPNIDLEYLVTHNKVKENIVIKAKQSSYEFSFELNVGDYKVQLSKDSENIELLDGNNQVQFIIPSPVMVDSQGEVSNDVTYELEELGDGVHALIVRAEASWINASDRVLPVKIDPQFISVSLIESDLTQYAVVDTEIKQVSSGGMLGKSQIVGQVAKKHRHIITILQENFLNYKIDLAFFRAHFANLNNRVIHIGTYATPLTSKVNPNRFTYTSSKYSHVGDFTVDSENHSYYVSPLLTDSLLDENAKPKSIVAFLMDVDSDIMPLVNIESLEFIIHYRPESIDPTYYLNLGQRTVTEVISTLELAMEEIEEVKDGVLTTIIDTENKKVYQQYLIDNIMFIRASYELSTNNHKWNKWQKISNDITINDTRDQDYEPSYYMEKGSSIVNELKLSVTLKNSHLGVGEFGLLTTHVPRMNESGGLPMQEYRSDGILLTRKAYQKNNEYFWTEWTKPGVKIEYKNNTLFITDDESNPKGV